MTAPCDARCCDAAEVPLLEADVARLQAATGLARAALLDASDGWLVLKGTGMEDGCRFLTDVTVGGRRVRGCGVHLARPAACRTYPFVLAGPPERAEVRRDPLCPFRAAFTPPPDVAARLLALERQLEEERRRRQADGV